jgi:succinate dehydrogenase flavin-adding protein (antitoxin of CptAB toxin-antitoxin module)
MQFNAEKLEELKQDITEEDLLVLYNYIDEFFDKLNPETRATLFSLLLELDNKLLEDEENQDIGSRRLH